MRHAPFTHASLLTRFQVSSVRRGAAIVKMAIVLRVFMMLVLIIIEFGGAMLVSQMVTNASREGCRRAILDDSQNFALKRELRDFLSNCMNVCRRDIKVKFYVNDVRRNVSTAVQNDKIKVRVEIGYDAVSYVTEFWLAGINLVGETTICHERPPVGHEDRQCNDTHDADEELNDTGHGALVPLWHRDQTRISLMTLPATSVSR